jgi:hypothetical protein
MLRKKTKAAAATYHQSVAPSLVKRDFSDEWRHVVHASHMSVDAVALSGQQPKALRLEWKTHPYVVAQYKG